MTNTNEGQRKEGIKRQSLEEYVKQRLGIETKGSFDTPKGVDAKTQMQYALLRHMNATNPEDFKFIARKKMSDEELFSIVLDYYRSQGCGNVKDDGGYISFERDGKRYLVNITNFSPEEVFIGVVDVQARTGGLL